MGSVKIKDLDGVCSQGVDNVAGGGDLPGGDGRHMRGREGGPAGRMDPKSLNTEPIPKPRPDAKGKKLKI